MESSRNTARVKRLVKQLSAGGPTSWADAVAADGGPTFGPYRLELDVDVDENLAKWVAPLNDKAGKRVGTVAVVFHLDGDTVRIKHVVHTPDPGNVPDTTFMKTARQGALYRQIQGEFKRATTLWALPSSWLPALVDESVLVPRPGRPKRERFYAEWAQRYVDAQQANPRQPIKYLLAQYPEESENTVRAFLRRAREHKLLTAAGAGKAGGRLTAKAKRLLQEGH